MFLLFLTAQPANNLVPENAAPINTAPAPKAGLLTPSYTVSTHMSQHRIKLCPLPWWFCSTQVDGRKTRISENYLL